MVMKHCLLLVLFSLSASQDHTLFKATLAAQEAARMKKWQNTFKEAKARFLVKRFLRSIDEPANLSIEYIPIQAYEDDSTFHLPKKGSRYFTNPVQDPSPIKNQAVPAHETRNYRLRFGPKQKTKVGVLID